jgi:hypothetical protein
MLLSTTSYPPLVSATSNPPLRNSNMETQGNSKENEMLCERIALALYSSILLMWCHWH